MNFICLRDIGTKIECMLVNAWDGPGGSFSQRFSRYLLMSFL